MKNPTSKQVQTVIDTFEKVLPMANYEGHLYMMSITIDNPSCGTPMCHAGWWGVARGINSFSLGTIDLSETLGFSDEYNLLTFDINELQIVKWADDNPSIWGNTHGFFIFSHTDAFGDNCNSLQDIVNHWKGVRDRLRADEESKGVFLWYTGCSNDVSGLGYYKCSDDIFTKAILDKYYSTAPQAPECYPQPIRVSRKRPVIDMGVMEFELN